MSPLQYDWRTDDACPNTPKRHLPTHFRIISTNRVSRTLLPSPGKKIQTPVTFSYYHYFAIMKHSTVIHDDNGKNTALIILTPQICILREFPSLPNIKSLTDSRRHKIGLFTVEVNSVSRVMSVNI